MKLNLKSLAFFFLFFSSIHLFSQSLNLEWAYAPQSVGWDEASEIVQDSAGFIYVTGYFGQTTDFDPSAGTAILNSNVGTDDLFVLKLDPFGNLVWAKGTNVPSLVDVRGEGLAIDDAGNIYVTGYFDGTVDFDPGPAVNNLTSNGGTDIFVLKLDNDGVFQWAHSFGDYSEDEGVAITTDPMGNVCVTGFFKFTVDFDPGSGINNLTALNREVFVLKLDAAGNLVWAKSLEGTTSSDEGRDIKTDANGNIYMTGYFSGNLGIDPGVGSSFLYSQGNWDVFIVKWTAAGNLVWGRSIGGPMDDSGWSLDVDAGGNVYTTGYFEGTCNFDLWGTNTMETAVGNSDIFIQKLDSNGWFQWVKPFGSAAYDWGQRVEVDNHGDVYITGFFVDSIDFDPGPGVHQLRANGAADAFIQKLTNNGDFLWATSFGGTHQERCRGLLVDKITNDVYTAGKINGVVDFDPSSGVYNLGTNGWNSMFVYKMSQHKIWGEVYQDFNQNCNLDMGETPITNRHLIINPGSLVVTTNSAGRWSYPSLPTGNYTITLDTSGAWIPTCSPIQNFTVINTDSIMRLSDFGVISGNPCPAHTISINAPTLRPGFSNQKVYVHACNDNIATAIIDSAYVIVELDALLTVQNSSLPFTSLGNNLYKVELDSLYPNECADFWLNCTLSNSAVLGQSLCMKANLYPTSPCIWDSIPNPYPSGFSACTSSYDFSHLELSATCENDTIKYTLTNTGTGNMSCFAPIRVFVDGQYLLMDSIQLNSGLAANFAYVGDGRTWRMEVNQHPLHPGNSQPSATVERCGSLSNWTPNLVNLFPHDDANPDVDIFCGVVTGSYDPNDKRGFPLGLGTENEILPQQDLDYIIRFQNTGTDTAFVVVIRDTLPMELDILSLREGAASHDYSFRIYGPRVLEWRFNNIILPDSSSNLIASQGFVSFKVKQAANLPLGTIINNHAAIYFDFNQPIITNTSKHKLAVPKELNWDGTATISRAICDSFIFNYLNYNQSGVYYNTVQNGGQDSLYTLNLTINHSSSSQLTENACMSYTAPDSQVYTTSGQYIAVLPNAKGCDSTITIDLTINNTSSSMLTESACMSYTAPDSQIYTTSGQYIAVIPNAEGCDSTITIDLTINNTSSSMLTESACMSYTAPDSQVYTTSGQYIAVLPNAEGCDSTITIDLTINNTSSSMLTESACMSYTAPDSQVYTTSGQYIAVLPNAEGCDSTITIDLTIDTLVSDSIIHNGANLIAYSSGLSYQWLDCNNGNSLISGAINQQFIPVNNGSYAVAITNGSCVLISDCINVTTVGHSLIKNSNIKIYPNPTKGRFYIKKDNNEAIEIKIVNNLGQIIYHKTSNQLITEINLDRVTSGVYYLSISNGQSIVQAKIIKE
ncbi:DUF7619 domain-containing protein [Aureispira anguillae]|uniref:T9SS type A sorting domain-containing protein n=1 Tax=Aureispira anguillae TaxID=2864201 RepID=A0A915YCF4_9BACT|nr:T9SS type A sorting domain-containing protein [Aureispira anguillae]BDS10517.1 T9SS type A sorting domain-containing protein [Aureispira anguillae]